MSKINIYFISCKSDETIRYLVKAKNKKEAINKIWKRYIVFENMAIDSENKKLGYDKHSRYFKKDLEAENIETLMKELDDEYGDTCIIW